LSRYGDKEVAFSWPNQCDYLTSEVRVERLLHPLLFGLEPIFSIDRMESVSGHEKFAFAPITRI